MSAHGDPAPDDLAPGDAFGHYRIEGHLGRGGMGDVYRAATDQRSGPIALKVLRRDLIADQEYRRRFLHEARAATTVTHPHLVPILEAGETDGVPFLAMPLVEGRSLDRVISENGPLVPKQVVRVAEEIGSALDTLHAAGLMHRDIKPANLIMGSDGATSLTDFGLAKGTSGYQTLTAVGVLVGTLAYVSPERIRGERATPASDVYSLGCTLFECLVGVSPFHAPSQMTVMMGILQEEAPNPAWQRSELSENFGAVVISALAKDPAARPASGAAYAEALKRALPSAP
ncbi:MAG: serine/threonine-protein kinase [Solirubrobacteraceae bacterium]